LEPPATPGAPSRRCRQGAARRDRRGRRPYRDL